MGGEEGEGMFPHRKVKQFGWVLASSFSWGAEFECIPACISRLNSVKTATVAFINISYSILGAYLEQGAEVNDEEFVFF